MERIKFEKTRNGRCITPCPYNQNLSFYLPDSNEAIKVGDYICMFECNYRGKYKGIDLTEYKFFNCVECCYKEMIKSK